MLQAHNEMLLTYSPGALPNGIHQVGRIPLHVIYLCRGALGSLCALFQALLGEALVDLGGTCQDVGDVSLAGAARVGEELHAVTVEREVASCEVQTSRSQQKFSERLTLIS